MIRNLPPKIGIVRYNLSFHPWSFIFLAGFCGTGVRTVGREGLAACAGSADCDCGGDRLRERLDHVDWIILAWYMQ